MAVLYSSNLYGPSGKYTYIPLDVAIGYRLELKSNLAELSSCHGTGRFCKTLKFKYYTDLNDFRLIGYDEEAFGNAAHEGAYTKSVNLLTGKYEIYDSQRKKKIIKMSKFQKITVGSSNAATFEYLTSIGSDVISSL